MSSVVQDLRYALRTLGRAPVFTAIALVTLAVGTGANVTVFSFVNALLFKPAPGVMDPGSLIAVYTSDFSSGPYGGSSYPDFVSLQQQASAFGDIAGESGGDIAALRSRTTVERVRLAAVTGTYFGLLGLRPALGRLIATSDTNASAPPVAVIGNDLWRRAFARDPGVVGSSVVLNGTAFTVVGVAPAGFRGLELGRAADVWMPDIPPPASAKSRGNRGMSIVARLRPGVSLSEAQTQLSGIAAQLASAYPETNLGILSDPKAPRPITAIRQTRMPPEFRPRDRDDLRDSHERGRPGAPHRLREYCGARHLESHDTKPGDRDPPRARSKPRTRASAARDRERGAGARRWRARPAVFTLDRRRAPRLLPAGAVGHARGRAGPAHTRLRARHLDRQQHPVWPCAGLAGCPALGPVCTQRRRGPCVGHGRHDAATPSRSDVPGCRGRRPSRDGRPARAEPVERAHGGSRFCHAGCRCRVAGASCRRFQRRGGTRVLRRRDRCRPARARVSSRRGWPQRFH